MASQDEGQLLAVMLIAKYSEPPRLQGEPQCLQVSLNVSKVTVKGSMVSMATSEHAKL
jgi:hypothetical protein